MAYIAGQYSATYNAAAIGQIEDGFEVEYGAVVQDIMSDMFRAREDGVFQGIEFLVRFVLMEPTVAGVARLVWPWSTTVGQSGVVGRLMTTMAAPLVLTACAGTNASPASLTFTRAVMWTDRVTSKYASEARKIPVTVAVLPVPLSAAPIMGCAGGTFYTAT
jgi:hypothetical protein